MATAVFVRGSVHTKDAGYQSEVFSPQGVSKNNLSPKTRVHIIICSSQFVIGHCHWSLAHSTFPIVNAIQ